MDTHKIDEKFLLEMLQGYLEHQHRNEVEEVVLDTYVALKRLGLLDMTKILDREGSGDGSHHD